MDPGAAGLLLLQGGPPGDGGGQGHILKSVHFLVVGAKPHEKQACQGHVIFLAEIHQPLCGLCLQVEDIQGRGGVVCDAEGGSQLWIFKHLPHGLQPGRAVEIIVDGLGLFDLLLEIVDVSLLCLAARLVGEIPLDLFNVRGHILGVGNALVLGVAVQLDDVLQEADEGLGVHDHVISQEVHAVKSVRHLDHDDPCQGRVKHLKRHGSPLLHLGLRLLYSPAGEIRELDIHLLRVCHILVPGPLFIPGKADAHGLAPCVGLVDGLFQLIPVKLHFDSQACPDIQHRHAGTVGRIVHVEFLGYSQRIHFVTFSCSHHFIIPPINTSRASSYALVSL